MSFNKPVYEVCFEKISTNEELVIPDDLTIIMIAVKDRFVILNSSIQRRIKDSYYNKIINGKKDIFYKNFRLNIKCEDISVFTFEDKKLLAIPISKYRVYTETCYYFPASSLRSLGDILKLSSKTIPKKYGKITITKPNYGITVNQSYLDLGFSNEKIFKNPVFPLLSQAGESSEYDHYSLFKKEECKISSILYFATWSWMSNFTLCKYCDPIISSLLSPFEICRSKEIPFCLPDMNKSINKKTYCFSNLVYPQIVLMDIDFSELENVCKCIFKSRNCGILILFNKDFRYHVEVDCSKIFYQMSY